MLPNQYCLAEQAESWAMRARAAVAWAGPGAALSGLAALAAWGYAPLPIELIEVLVPPGGHRRGPTWLQVRTLSAPIRSSVWSPATSIVTPSLALVMAYGSIPARDRATFVHGTVRARIVDARELGAELARLPRVAGRAELAQRTALIAKGAESYLEERGMADIFRGAGFADVLFQHKIVARGFKYRLDVFHPPSRTAFEMDSAGHHGSERARQYDVARDATLATLGVLTVRYTYQDIIQRPGWCRDTAREVIEARIR